MVELPIEATHIDTALMHVGEDQPYQQLIYGRVQHDLGYAFLVARLIGLHPHGMMGRFYGIRLLGFQSDSVFLSYGTEPLGEVQWDKKNQVWVQVEPQPSERRHDYYPETESLDGETMTSPCPITVELLHNAKNLCSEFRDTPDASRELQLEAELAASKVARGWEMWGNSPEWGSYESTRDRLAAKRKPRKAARDRAFAAVEQMWQNCRLRKSKALSKGPDSWDDSDLLFVLSLQVWDLFPHPQDQKDICFWDWEDLSPEQRNARSAWWEGILASEEAQDYIEARVLWWAGAPDGAGRLRWAEAQLQNRHGPHIPSARMDIEPPIWKSPKEQAIEEHLRSEQVKEAAKKEALLYSKERQAVFKAYAAMKSAQEQRFFKPSKKNDAAYRDAFRVWRQTIAQARERCPGRVFPDEV